MSNSVAHIINNLKEKAMSGQFSSFKRHLNDMRSVAPILGFLFGGLALGACTSTTSTATGLSSETVVTTSELPQLLTGKTVAFSGGGRAIYHADGRYEYRGGRGGRGTYSFRDNQVCVDFTNSSFSRCDRYVRTGDGYVLVNGNGRRFKVRIS